MLGKVLTGNGITAYGNGAYSLIGGDELSDGERDELLELCRQQLKAFREQRGEEVACLLFRSLRLRAPQPPPQPDQRLSELQGCSPAPGAAASGAVRTSTRGPWRWHPSSPETEGI
jgi:hypothetical protein